MKIMAVDLGDARTGLAACDRTEFLALSLIHISVSVLTSSRPGVCRLKALISSCLLYTSRCV